MKNFKVKNLDIKEVNATLLELKAASKLANTISSNTFLQLSSYMNVLESALDTLQAQYNNLVYYETYLNTILSSL